MKQNILKIVFVALLGTVALTSCKSTSESSKRQQQGQQRGGERLTVVQIFTQMDANKDSKISKSEAKGPLAEGFSVVDTNKDGFISKEELKNAPKPERKKPRN